MGPPCIPRSAEKETKKGNKDKQIKVISAMKKKKKDDLSKRGVIYLYTRTNYPTLWKMNGWHLISGSNF